MIFVFGSNLAGRHGKGAALTARLHHGAELGVGEGLSGSSYAIPTKDKNLKVLPLEDIKEAIHRFLQFAKISPGLEFKLTPIGCGLAGYKRSEIWAILKAEGVPPNVYLTSTWVTYND